MDADWGGLQTLLAAAEYVESQEERQKSQKLIEICGKCDVVCGVLAGPRAVRCGTVL